MLGIVLLSLLGIGATAALAIDLFDDNDDNARAPDTPGEEEPETGGPGPLPEEPETGGPDPLPTDTINPITGTAGADSITGTEAVDFIDAEDGDDVVRGGAEGDIIDAGDGDDRVFGEDGQDVIAGNAGNDFLRGGADEDILADSDGADTLRGDTGDDLILSTGLTDQTAFIDATRTVARDFANGDAASLDDLPGLDLTRDEDTEGDEVDGGAGNDVMIFGQDDTVTGGDGADLFIGGSPLLAGNPATITDFEVNEELLVLTYDGGDPPDLSLTDVNGDAVLSLDGAPAVIVAGLGGSFLLSDVELIELAD
ncbi:Leukotoxin [Roseovarius sp. THAF27]|uniref:calcium-binding protein n=1 Tax=Roseovarius sp. THAF27 TaxID=2587850 RepID=UPI0012A92758|nr:hypothetical protein [Roseovarius sp. THAF27]QFT80690.1 Leukotoxin [Roseovarius sp. THAF27]